MEKEEINDPDPVQGEVVGIDLGLTHFAASSNGEKVSALDYDEKINVNLFY